VLSTPLALSTSIYHPNGGKPTSLKKTPPAIKPVVFPTGKSFALKEFPSRMRLPTKMNRAFSFLVKLMRFSEDDGRVGGRERSEKCRSESLNRAPFGSGNKN
jgi:hypothetical protein